MKTANCKVRVKDIKQGVTIYTAHPVYGINKSFIMGRPYVNEHTKSLFVKARAESKYGSYNREFSLCDAGISPGESYNGRRTFFKLKQAEAWMDKWAKQRGFIEAQQKHEEYCNLFDMIDDDY